MLEVVGDPWREPDREADHACEERRAKEEQLVREQLEEEQAGSKKLEATTSQLKQETEAATQAGSELDALKKQLSAFKNSPPCPFLLNGACAIHPLRPMACRQFNVFNKQCEEGEDPFYTRREDVMDPVKKHVDQAFYVMLPYYKVESESERFRIIETGSFHRMAKELHSCDWKELAGKMERAEKRKTNIE